MKAGWQLRTLGDVCNKASSNVAQNQLKDDNGDYAIYGASGLIKRVSFYHHDKPYLSIVKDGSGVGRVTKMEAYSSVIGTMQYIIPKDDIDLDYLYYSLLGVDFKKYAAGAAIPHIYFKDYKNEPFLWMPLAEQKLIVNILEKSFDDIATAIANAEKNLINARELFNSYLQSIFADKSKGWEEKTIGETCDLIDSLHKTPNYAKNGNYPMVRVTEVKYGNLDISGALRVDEETFNEFSKKHKPKYGDIVFSRVGASFGVSSFVASDDLFCLGQNTSFIVAKFNPLFCYHFMTSGVARSQMNKLVAGAAQPTISLKSIKELKITLPPLIEQAAIVEKIEALSIEIQNLEKIYQIKVDAFKKLKKSILHQAFTGQLS